jgi:IS605 OrfB family transposase
MQYQGQTRRAYTMRLTSAKDANSNACLALWETHKLVNKGTKAFGDLWLTLRGGLAAKLVEQVEDKAAAQVLLTLGWLTVEAPANAVPKNAIVASADQPPGERSAQLEKRLVAILKGEGLDDAAVEAWLATCKPTFAANIREDSVWVDRRGLFNQSKGEFAWTSDHAKQVVLDEIIGAVEDYLSLAEGDGEKKDYAQKAGGWISRNWGSGKKSDTNAILEKLGAVLAIDRAALLGKDTLAVLGQIHKAVGAQPAESEDKQALLDQIKKAFGWLGRPSAGCMALNVIAEQPIFNEALAQRLDSGFSKEIVAKQAKAGKAQLGWAGKVRALVEKATGLPFRVEKDHIWEYGVMLDHALRRVSIAHSWAKRAEKSRREFDDAANAASDQIVSNWVENYTAERAIASGSLDGYVIRRNALDGWREVCQAWQELGSDATAEKRLKAARGLQEELEKFGDIQLFEAIADANPAIWSREGKAKPELLDGEVRRRMARNDQTRFKVPAYRHPDPFLNPVFCDYGNSRWSISYGAKESGEKEDARRLTLATFNHGKIQQTDFRWQSKRLATEITNGLSDPKLPESSRSHRLARAASRLQEGQAVRTAGLLALNDWNGRLQASRAKLERIHRQISKGVPKERIEKALAAIPWLITFSVPLVPQGPWLDFVAADPILSSTKAIDKLSNPKFEAAGLSFPFDHPANGKSRKGMARLHLSRLHGLRLLSVDLGHRHAAACAVWQTLSSQEVTARCAKSGVPGPGPEELFLHLQEGKRKKVFRRVGGDRLPTGEKNPAPWAELDRQFVLPLAGEDTEARYANDAERDSVAKLEKMIGIQSNRKPKDWRMDRLQLDLVRQARLGLARHATMARLALGLTAGEKVLPGGRKFPFTGREDRVAYIQALLAQMHRLILDTAQVDASRLKVWRDLSEDALGSDAFEPSATKKAGVKSVPGKLAVLAGRFVDDNELSKRWADIWRNQWDLMDGRWRNAIKAIRQILLPRGKRGDKTIRRRGGLSLGRLSAIEEFRRKVQLAFYTRQKMEGDRLEAPLEFSARALRALEKLRENRVRQISSRITAAALGIGPDRDKPGRLVKRFETCHAVVIESLGNYRPDATQTRRENRQLMQWSSGKIRKLLAEACQLSGLHLREVSPAFTSRQDSRTGAGGSRAVEVAVEELRREGGYWQREVAKAEERVRVGKGSPADNYLVKLFEATSLSGNVIIPRRGGDLFVSGDNHAPLVIQADLNAAANIGLAALMDPDWGGKWWFVPAGRDTHVPEKALEVAEPLALGAALPLDESAVTGLKGKAKGGKNAVIARHFRDLHGGPLDKSSWYVGFPAYEVHVLAKVLDRLESKYLNDMPF